MLWERPRPRLIPVLDVMGGVVVHAVSGKREDYKPITCPFSGSRRVVDIADTLAQLSGTSELYVADIDAIRGHPTLSPKVFSLLAGRESPAWVDAGFGGGKGVEILPMNPWVRPVVGLETAGEPSVLGQTVAFSIDLKDRRLLGNWSTWGASKATDVIAVARTAVKVGFRTLIVLDLARVGTGTGSGTEGLLCEIRAEFPGVELIAGGGVKTWDDIDRLGEAGADAVLVSSALHNGTITFPRPASEGRLQ